MKEALQKFSQTDPWRKIVLENALDAVIGIDHESNVIDWNAQAERTFGWTKDEAIGSKISDLIIPPEYRPAHYKGVDHFLKTGEGPILNRRIEVTAITKDGIILPVELTVIPILIEGKFIFYSFVRDQTTQKETETQKLKLRNDITFLSETTRVLLADPLGLESRLEKLIRMVIPTWADACILDVVNARGTITESIVASPKNGKLDIAFKELNSEKIVFTGEACSTTIMNSKLTEKELTDLWERTGHEVKPGSYLCIPLNAHKKNLGSLTLISESPERYDPLTVELLEEVAHRSAFAVYNARLYQEATEAVSARDEFLSIASHELKTPMTSIMLMTQLYLKRHPENELTPELKKLLDLFEKNLSRMLRLIEDMLDISRIAHGKIRFEKKEMDLGALLVDILQRRHTEISNAMKSVQMDIEKNLTGVWDMYRIEQVLSNIINNALKYAPGTDFRITAKKERSLAHVIFQDTGKGIHQENLDLIFSRFERVVGQDQVGGLGLGLYISRQIIEAHGGKIWAESGPGKGSAFHIELPLK